MLKNLCFIFLSFFFLRLTAQDSTKTVEEPILKNKKGHEILPKKGDIGLGFNTIPVLDYVMSAFKSNMNGSSANLVQYTSNSNNQITGKYFLDAKTAVRVRFGINSLTGQIINRVQDAKAMYTASFGTADDIARAKLLKVDDKVIFAKSNIVLSFGIEKRRGYRRMQGFYGAEVGLGTTSSAQTVTYGNKFSDLFPVDFTSDFNNLTITTQSPTSSFRVVRVLEIHDRTGVRLGSRIFIGLEYFVASKISITAEYGWSYSFVSQRAATSKQEVYFNGQNGPSVITESLNQDSHQIQGGFTVDNNNGNIFSLNNTLNGNTTLSGGAGALTILFYF